MKVLPVAAVVTQNCYKEFLLEKFSLEQYHTCEWYISCDQYVSDALSNFKNVSAHRLIESDNCDHNSTCPIQQDNFLKVVLTKFDICEAAIEDHGGVLFLDADMLFLNPIEDKMLSLFGETHLDGVLSQHMTNNWKNEERHGYYNVGMFFLRNTSLIENWRYLAQNHRQLGMYYEQKPLEYVQRNYITANLPIYYNIGWWRFNETYTRDRLEKLHLKNEKIMFGDNEAVNFHFHVYKNPGGFNPGRFLVDKVLSILATSNHEPYKDLLQYHEELSKISI